MAKQNKIVQFRSKPQKKKPPKPKRIRDLMENNPLSGYDLGDTEITITRVRFKPDPSIDCWWECTFIPLSRGRLQCYQNGKVMKRKAADSYRRSFLNKWYRKEDAIGYKLVIVGKNNTLKCPFCKHIHYMHNQESGVILLDSCHKCHRVFKTYKFRT